MPADSRIDRVAPRRPRRPLLRGIVLGVLLVWALRFTVNHTPIADWVTSPLFREDQAGPADAIVVLGAGATRFCTPNLPGLQRTIRGAALYREQQAPVVVFTGGGQAGQDCTVADSMASMAEQLGVPASRIRLERASSSTWENALRSDAVLKAIGARRIRLVTDRLHMPRAEACFRPFGYTILRSSVPVPLGHADNWSQLTLGLREYAAWAYYWARGRFGDAPDRALVPTVAPAAAAPGASVMSSPATPLAHPDGPLVILGASYAKNWTPRLAGRPVINSGVAGQQSFELLERFDRDVVAHQPRAVIIWGFINDVFRTPRPSIAEGLTRARESIMATVAKSRAAGIEPILATEVTIRYKAGLKERLAVLVGTALGKQGYYAYVNRHVLDTNAWLREYAAREGILLLDLQPVVSDASGLRRAAFANEDGSHMPPAAYDALSAYAVPRLEPHLAAR